MVSFLMLQLLKGILVNIHTKFGLFTCLVCPTIEINMCTVALKKSLINPHEHPHTFQYHDHSRSTNGSDENTSYLYTRLEKSGSLRRNSLTSVVTSAGAATRGTALIIDTGTSVRTPP